MGVIGSIGAIRRELQRRSYDIFRLLALISLSSSPAFAVCDTNTVGTSPVTITYSPSNQTVSLSARVTQTGTRTGTNPGCVSGQNVNVGTVRFSSAIFSQPVSDTGGNAGVHSVAAAVIGGTGAGNYPISADYSGSASNGASTGSIMLVIARASQSINFTSAAPANTEAGSSYSLSASATSGLPVSFSIDPASNSVCSLSGSTVTFTAAGICTINANQAGNANYNSAPQAQQNVTVGAECDTSTLATAPTPIRYSPSSQSVSLTSRVTQTGSHTGGNPGCVAGRNVNVGTVNFSSTAFSSTVPDTGGNAGVHAANATIPAGKAPGSYPISLNYGGSTNNGRSNDSTTLVISQASQTVTFTSAAPTNAVVGAPNYAATATSTSGLQVTLTIDAASASVCTIANGSVSFIGSGTCSINANQAGDANYNSASQVQQIFLVKGSNTISFPQPADTSFTNPPPTLSATASSGLPVNYASNSASVCTVSGSTLTFVSSGICSITASQAGNASYAAATPVTRTFNVTGGSNTINFPQPADSSFGSPPPALSANASSGLPITYASNSTSVCTVSGSTLTFVSSGTCSVTASQPGNSSYSAATPVTRAFSITSGTNTISFQQPADTSITGTPSTLSATASSGLPVSFVSNSASICSVSGTTLTFLSSGTCSVTASQAGNTSYASATPVTRTFNVISGANIISFSQPADTSFTSAPPALSASASSGLPVSFVSNSASICTVAGGTLTFLSGGLCSITASQAGNSSYATATPLTRTFNVTGGANVISFPPLADTSFTSSPPPLSGSASSGLSITYASNTTGVCKLSGAILTFVSSGVCSITASQPGNPSYAAAISVTRTLNVTSGNSVTSLISSSNTAAFGQSVTLTASVSGPGASTAPTGRVTFKDGETVLGTISIAGGSAVLTSSTFSVGSHAVKALYEGDTSYLPSTSPVTALMVQQAATVVTLTSSANPSSVGQVVTLTAVVSSSIGSPSGIVRLMDGTAVIATLPLTAGVSRFMISSLTLGQHVLTASYAGSGDFAGSVSESLLQAVNTPTDSLRLRGMQALAAPVAAQISGQVITSAIDTALSEAFSEGGALVSPTSTGIRFNFSSDQNGDDTNNRLEDSSASGASQTSSRGDTMSPRGGASERLRSAFGAFASVAPIKGVAPQSLAPRDWFGWAEIRGGTLDRWNASAVLPGQNFLYGNQLNALVGLTRKISSNIVLGILGGYETFDYRSDGLAGQLKGQGPTLGSYFGWRLTPSIRWDASVAYSNIEYDGKAGLAAGSFAGNRLLIGSGFTGTAVWHKLNIEPSIRMYAMWEHESAYVDTLGTQQAARDIMTGRASGGIKMSHPVAWSDAVALVPYAGIYGDYYFNKDTSGGAATLERLPPGVVFDGWSARAAGGVVARFKSGNQIAIGTERAGIGGGFAVWTYRARVSMAFAAQ